MRDFLFPCFVTVLGDRCRSNPPRNLGRPFLLKKHNPTISTSSLKKLTKKWFTGEVPVTATSVQGWPLSNVTSQQTRVTGITGGVTTFVTMRL